MTYKEKEAEGILAWVVFQDARHLNNSGRAGSIIPSARGGWLGIQVGTHLDEVIWI